MPDDRTQSRGDEGRAYRVASLLFLLSGATGLAYEVIWFKRFSHVWGNSTLASAAVVASFLSGLGLGALRLGRLADRVRSPLLWYGLCEVGVGLLALLIPYEIGALLRSSARVSAPLLDRPVAHALTRFAFTFLIIGPPCVLMGGTLPLLIRQFAASARSVDRPTAWLYAINTLGAATGCYVAGFHLLPSIGLAGSNAAVAGLNLAIGAVAIILSRSVVPAAPRAPVPDAAPPRPPEASRALFALGLASAATGCAALVLQIVWTRQLALILGGSTYAFTAMLCPVLIGIGAGSLVYHAWLEDRPLGRAPVLVVLVLVGSILIGEALIAQLTYVVALALPLRASHAFNAVLSLGASASLELVPAIGMGVLFPLLVHFRGGGAREAGTTVGAIYAWNTLGTLAGAITTALVLIPTWGCAASVAVALGLYAAAAVLLSPSGGAPDRLWQVGVCAVVGSAIVLTRGQPDPRLTNIGMYLYGYSEPADVLARLKLFFFKEGPAGNVLVDQAADGAVRLHINGKVDATSTYDMPTQLGSAYFPRFLRPQSEKVLVIGFGSGTTAGASLLFPGTQVTCCEIEPAVIAASSYFGTVNHRPQESPRFSLVMDDGRSYLQATSGTYDLIISEPSNPWIAGMSNLFTREFYEAVREHLGHDGMLVQWLQLYQVSAQDYGLIVRTIASVFPYYRVVMPRDLDSLILASSVPIEGTVATVRAAQAAVDALPEVQADLTKYFGSTDVVALLLRYLVLDEEALGHLARADGSSVINTDLNMRLEYDSPRRLFDPHIGRSVEQAVLAAANPDRFAENFAQWGGTKAQAKGFHDLAGFFAANGLLETAGRIAEAGLRVDPERPELLGDRLTLSARTVDRAAFEESLPAILARSEERAAKIGSAFQKLERPDLAIAVFERLAAQNPGSATVWRQLAQGYERVGRKDEARDALRRARALDPFDEDVQEKLRALEKADTGSR